ncbi:hypothetical protein [Stenotrophomonas geniculata]|nr:hypothetical protein [Stenotrophomonas geniculata]WNF09030.1 hypothetical protein RKE57_13210 [Stenotrophomonas geniculata]
MALLRIDASWGKPGKDEKRFSFEVGAGLGLIAWLMQLMHWN